MKSKPPKDIRERRKQQLPRNKGKAHSKWDWKVWAGLAIGVASSIVTAMGLVLAIEARPTMSLETPLNPDDVLSTPFVISNDGALSLEDVNVATVMKGFEDAGHNRIGVGTGWGFVPTSREMKPGERKTVPAPFNTMVKDAQPVIAGEYGVVVSFKPAYFPIWTKYRGFRFTIARQSDGRSRFEQQPGQGIEEEYKLFMERR